MGTTCAGVQVLSLKFCQALHKYGYLPLCQTPEWQKPCYADGRHRVPEGVPSPPAQHYVRVFTLHTPPLLESSPDPLNPSVPYYCHTLNLHFYIALFTTCYQKQEHCRDQQTIEPTSETRHTILLYLWSSNYILLICAATNPGQENYMLFAVFRTEDFLKSCMQQHFSYTSTFSFV